MEELEATHQFITESLAKGYIMDSKCYVQAEHSTRLEWEGYDQVALRIVHEACASDTR